MGLREFVEDFARYFKNWDIDINRLDFKVYKCKRCGKLVDSYKQWTRGRTLCLNCFEEI